MNGKLRILNLEDSPHDTELIQALLEEEGLACEITRVETKDDYVDALVRSAFDLLLVDYKLPSFDGLSALAIARERYTDIPFIFVSGSIGEDMAIEAMKNGATDYILKDKLARLAPAVRRALKEAEQSLERKRAEEALKESEDRYRSLFENSIDAVLLTSPDGRVLAANPAACRIFGRTEEEICRLGREGLTDTEDLRLTAAIEERSKTGKFRGELTLVRKDGSKFSGEISTVVYTDRQGLVKSSMIIRDITERKKAEVALQESERKYKSLVEATVDGIYQSDANGVFVIINQAGAEIFGHASPEEMIGRPLIDYWVDPEDRVSFVDKLRKVKVVKAYPISAKRKDGTVIYLEMSSRIMEDEQGRFTGIEGVLRDVTDKKKLEEQLRHSQKMEAIGTLAGGIAHDFNNVLNVILGFAALAQNQTEQGHPSIEYLNEVLAAAERAATLTQRLLIFSRRQAADLRPVSVNDIVISLEKMLSRIIGEDVELVTQHAGGELMIMADAGQMEQVLMNLAANSRDAMPKGGRLTIRTGITEMNDAFIAAHGYGERGKYAIITVSDTGSGMDAETMGKIFEPFFTTKGVGQGTGLGLSIAYGIIKQHHGFINVYSEQGKGTTFRILIPLIEHRAGAGIEAVPGDSPRGGTETILVAEDDASLRRLARVVLETFGYTVIMAEDGEDAVSKFLENRDRIDLVLLDMIMPKRNGKEVYEEIRSVSPEIRILFMSGYAMDVINARDIIEEGMELVLKPVSPQDLLNKVREVLDR